MGSPHCHQPPSGAQPAGFAQAKASAYDGSLSTAGSPRPVPQWQRGAEPCPRVPFRPAACTDPHRGRDCPEPRLPPGWLPQAQPSLRQQKGEDDLAQPHSPRCSLGLPGPRCGSPELAPAEPPRHRHCPCGCTSTRSPTGSTRGRAASAPRWCPGAAAPLGSSSTRCQHPWWPDTSRAPASHLHGHSTSPSPSSLHPKMGSSAKGRPSGVLELPCLSTKDRRPPRAPSSPLLPGQHPCPRTGGCRRRGAPGRRRSHPCAAREPSASPPTRLAGSARHGPAAPVPSCPAHLAAPGDPREIPPP